MFGKIVYISDNMAHVEIPQDKPLSTDLMNMHVVFEDEDKKILGEVLNAIKEKENGAKVTLDIKKADNETLRAYLAEVLPNFDRERVYPTDIKKLISWYNLLVETGNTDFVEEEKTQKDADVENTAATDDSVNEKEEKSKTKKSVKE